MADKLGPEVSTAVAALSDLNVAYLDEVGVLPEVRRDGVGRILVSQVMNDLGRQARTSVARTMASPPTELYGWFLRKGQEAIADYDDGSGRVVLAGPSMQLRTIDSRLER